MKKGNVFVDKEGTTVNKIEVEKRNDVLRNYYVMREEAKSIGDKFFYVNAQEWEDFFVDIYTSGTSYWKGVDIQLIAALQNGAFPLKLLDDISEFDALNAPKSHGGYAYDGHPTTNYIHDTETWEGWHQKWNLAHIDEADAEPLHNGVWPCFKKVVGILSQELQKAGKNVPLTDKEVVDSYHDQIMKHLDERERISVSNKIGTILCEANYYHREEKLEALEADHGNKRAERIFSIMIGTKYQFLCIDKKHGMLELCDDKGDHLMEIRFDGSKNKDKESDHSLLCVAEWKRIYNK